MALKATKLKHPDVSLDIMSLMELADLCGKDFVDCGGRRPKACDCLARYVGKAVTFYEDRQLAIFVEVFRQSANEHLIENGKQELLQEIESAQET